VYRSLPVWLQWALPFGIAAVLVVALVVFVEHQTNDVSPIAGVTSKSALIEQNREDTELVRQQQAPHVARLGAGVSAASGLRGAVVKYMNYEINHGVMDGPVKRSSCHAAAAGGAGAGVAGETRLVLKCDVTASNVTYPFLGVVQPSAKRITYCQRVAPPIPSMNVPVSKRCT
jgi:hypothetical protein